MSREISPVVLYELHQISEPARATIADLLVNDLAVMKAAADMIRLFPSKDHDPERATALIQRLNLWEHHLQQLFNLKSQSEMRAVVASVSKDGHLGAVREEQR